MTLKSTVETLGRTAVGTTYSAVRHPFGTTARAAGLAKDTVGAGLGLVLNRHGRPSPAAEERAEQVRTTVTEVKQTIAATTAEAQKSAARTVEKAAPVAKDAVVETAEKAADEVEKTAHDVEKTAPVEPAAPKPTPAATQAKAAAAKTKPAHEPAEGTAPTGEQVEVEKVQKKATEKKPTQKKKPAPREEAGGEGDPGPGRCGPRGVGGPARPHPRSGARDVRTAGPRGPARADRHRGRVGHECRGTATAVLAEASTAARARWSRRPTGPARPWAR